MRQNCGNKLPQEWITEKAIHIWLMNCTVNYIDLGANMFLKIHFFHLHLGNLKTSTFWQYSEGRLDDLKSNVLIVLKIVFLSIKSEIYISKYAYNSTIFLIKLYLLLFVGQLVVSYTYETWCLSIYFSIPIYVIIYRYWNLRNSPISVLHP